MGANHDHSVSVTSLADEMLPALQYNSLCESVFCVLTPA